MHSRHAQACPGENAEEAAMREVKEEIGIELSSLEFAGTYWFKKNNLLMIGFIGQTQKCKFVTSNEVDSADWVPCDKVPEHIYPDMPDNAAYKIYKKYSAIIQKKR